MTENKNVNTVGEGELETILGIDANGHMIQSNANTYMLASLLPTLAKANTQISAGTGLTGGGSLSANVSISVSFGTTANTVAMGNDSRFSDAREWVAETIGETEAREGTSTDRYAWSSLRVRQNVEEYAASKNRTITAGDGLTGGGNLTANRTLSVNNTIMRVADAVNFASAAQGIKADTALQPTDIGITVASQTDSRIVNALQPADIGSSIAAQNDSRIVNALQPVDIVDLLDKTGDTMSGDLDMDGNRIVNAVGDFLPIGAVLFDPRGIGWPGFLELNGSSFDTGVYPDLALLYPSGVLPDFSDRVPRGAGPLAGAAGTTQEDAGQRIVGRLLNIYSGLAPISDAANIDGAFTSLPYNGSTLLPAQTSNSAGRPLGFNSGHSPGARVSDDETRVKAVIGKFYIKAYGAFNNVGDVDLVAIEQAQAFMLRMDAQTLAPAVQAQVHTNLNTDGRIAAHPGAAKAWVNFNGTGTVAIRDSFNVSSITDNGTGSYTVNFAEPMANTNYAMVGFARWIDDANTNGIVTTKLNSTKTVSACHIYSVNSAVPGSTTGHIDSPEVNVVFFGG